MNKKIKNIIFITAVLMSLTGIVIFNYRHSPYNFIQNGSYMELAPDKKYMQIYMDNYKYIKHENFVFGSSEAQQVFNNSDMIKPFFNSVFSASVKYKELYEMIKYYLELHPETKKAYFFISYTSFFFNQHNEGFRIYNKFEKNLKKLQLLLTFNNIKNHIKYKFQTSDYNYLKYHPLLIGDYSKKHLLDMENIQESFEYSAKILDLLKEKNIECSLFIPPYNAVYSAVLYNNEEYYNLTEDIKRFFIQYGNIYDFSIINEYTSQNLLDNTNYLYYNYDHANEYFGKKIIKAVFLNDSSEENLYILHTKDNLENNLKHERKSIEDYISKNKKYTELYLKIQENNSEKYSLYTRFVNRLNLKDKLEWENNAEENL